MPDVPVPRRAVVAAALGGLIALRAGAERRAIAQGPPAALTPVELETLVAWYDALVPGARKAGVADFVIAQLRVDPRLSLLQLRYLNWPPPYVAFYRAGIKALDAASRRREHAAFADLDPPAAARVAGAAAKGTLTPWPPVPPLPAWVTATRADGVDVVYGKHDALIGLDMPMVQWPPPRW